MSGIAPNPLNAISKVYLDQVAEAKVEPPKEKLKTDRNMFNIPKDEQQAAKERLLAKSAAKRKAAMEALDPVGQEDADIDNDGDTDKSDKYLHKRRKAIGKAMKKRMKEEKELAEVTKMGVHAPHEVPDKNLKGLVKKAVKRIDADNDGDVDKDDPKETGMGEFVPSPDGKKKIRTSVRTESFSNWRTDLTEVMDDDIDSKPIKEKKVNNKIKINPTLGEALEEIGATLIEMVEVDEFDFVVESVYDELLEEGYSEDEVEFGIETALTTLDEGYYDSAVAASKAKAKEAPAPKKSMKDRLKSAAKKAIVGGARTVGKAVRAGAAVAATPERAKRKASSIADRVKKAAKAGYAAGRGPVEPKSTYRGAGVGRKEKIGEETEIEEGIGMTMAKAVGNPPALSKRMKLKQALLNREIRKNAAENKKKSYSGKAATNEEVSIDENVGTGKAKRAKFGGVAQKVGKSEVVTNKEKGAALEKHFAAKKAAQKKAGEDAHKAASAKGLSPAEAEMRRKAAERKAARMRKEEVEQLDEKALSKAQQRFMGMVYATKKGKMAAPSPEVAKAAASMTGKEAKDFAKTKHKGLPEKKEVKEGATEMPMSPEELALQKKKTKIDLMISKKREQSLQKKKDT